MSDTPQKVQFHTGGIPLPLLTFILTIVIAVGSGYGGARYAAGAQEKTNEELQRQLNEHKAEIATNRANTISKEQMEFLLRMLDGMKQDQKDIKDDIRALRQERR
jgi:SpoVK/Ycf46/Vps4 family AAA+-type ATPase